ncbi:hypothetical protein T01_6490 [Trichinella spiralis]|uniref:Uncharacterized protein n=1 Tax=Trichinella spiralis TaxID=6334 RepID=A0A0V1B2U9_TRISP|nr:hypothetical protein T01_6490 [Trichinella spiralis]
MHNSSIRFDPLPQQTISDRWALGSMPERHAVQRMTERPAERRLVKSVARSHPRSSPAASLNWAGWEDLLPGLCVCLSWTCNEQRRRIAMVVTLPTLLLPLLSLLQSLLLYYIANGAIYIYRARVSGPAVDPHEPLISSSLAAGVLAISGAHLNSCRIQVPHLIFDITGDPKKTEAADLAQAS